MQPLLSSKGFFIFLIHVFNNWDNFSYYCALIDNILIPAKLYELYFV
jgi:hypothetical protein